MGRATPHLTSPPPPPDHPTYPPHRVLSISSYIHREYANDSRRRGFKIGQQEGGVSAHPPRCPGCRGSGYTDGPPIHETVNGQPHEYTTVKPCTHDFWNDDPGPYYEPRNPT